MLQGKVNIWHILCISRSNWSKDVVVICYLALLVNCDWTLEQSRLIATATVAGCSEFLLTCRQMRTVS